VARTLVDLLWRHDPRAPTGGTRGPRPKVSTSQAVDAAVRIADHDGLDAVTIRRLGTHLGVAANAVYTHVGSRDDLLVLMADQVRSQEPPAPYASDDWRERVRQVAADELALHEAHPWLLQVTDQRTAFGPGTIATYDHQLHALDGTGLADVDRDAALTFVTDFARASARARRPDPGAADMSAQWPATAARLAGYVGERYPLARRVGAAAGEAMAAPYSAEHAWQFGLERVLDALAALVDQAARGLHRS